MRADKRDAEAYCVLGAVIDRDFRASQVNGNIVITALPGGSSLPSQAAVDALDLPTAQLTSLYTKAKALLTADDPVSKAEKATLLVILDEFNSHANKINAILTAIDGAATFAAMKTAILAINDYPTRTAAQIKTSISGKIDAGQADG